LQEQTIITTDQFAEAQVASTIGAQLSRYKTDETLSEAEKNADRLLDVDAAKLVAEKIGVDANEDEDEDDELSSSSSNGIIQQQQQTMRLLTPDR
jgi:hypothetical protein